MFNNFKKYFFALLSCILILVIAFLWIDRENISVKNAPNDPQVNEMISQARALQKKGDFEDALIVFEKYALRGHPEAMYHVARAYNRGWGTQPNLDKARHYFMLAVEYNFSYRAETAYELGRLYQRAIGPDCNKIAMSWFTKAYGWKYTKAAMQLALHYEQGLGTKQNIRQAIFYYKVAASHGIEQALIRYARILQKGRYGTTADPEQALKLVERAIISLSHRSRGGSASAAKQLGRLYRNGELIPKNNELAKFWLLHAARIGNTGGMHDYAHLLLSISSNKETHKTALKWLISAAKKGHGGAMNSLGKYHLSQKYDLKRIGAVSWFNKGVAASHGGAIEQLAKLYVKGDLVEKDLEKAVELLEKGVALGHSGSARLLKRINKAQSANTKSQ
ncbi:MAG: sel1 repeat family protein [Alphaproteobacteria bacterium]|nr:sel1 repeat family protein [Alphaproteobacteria bacterium]